MIPLSTLGPAVGFGSAMLEQFKPSRSPYLLTALVGSFLVALALENSDVDYQRKVAVIFPIFIVITVLTILAFHFKPFEQTEIEQSKEEINIEIDNQFKLSRTTGLVIGITSFYLLAARRQHIDGLYFIFYLIVLVHSATFLVYIVFRNIKEESFRNISYFQLSFMTSLFLFMIAFSGAKVSDVDGAFMRDCKSTITFSARDEDDEKARRTVNKEVPDCVEPRLSDVVGRFGGEYNEIRDVKFAVREDWLSLYFVAAIFFSFLWLWLIAFWINQILRIWRGSKLVISD